LLDTYTGLTGRPALLPIWGYGFTYVCNDTIDDFGVCAEASQFRDRKFPCDVIGLEPGWMETNYDSTTRKKWHPKRFTWRYWSPRNNFSSALRRMGFKLSLWLCCNYDLFRYEEQLVAGEAKKMGRKVELPEGISETWHDDRAETGSKALKSTSQTAYEEQFKEGDLPWFEHLKKFVDQGAQCFKLDASYQVTERPTFIYANGMNDEEAHNVYSVVYAKQMSRGFEDHTKKRSMVYSAGGYAGVQQYVATWAGDTGGGEKPCASLLNLAFSGHSNQSCDMNIFSPASLHFGFLQTWSKQNNCAY
jgi:alpha-glucosidase (family GH31 glycosyl hydrolase)